MLCRSLSWSAIKRGRRCCGRTRRILVSLSRNFLFIYSLQYEVNHELNCLSFSVSHNRLKWSHLLSESFCNFAFGLHSLGQSGLTCLREVTWAVFFFLFILRKHFLASIDFTNTFSKLDFYSYTSLVYMDKCSDIPWLLCLVPNGTHGGGAECVKFIPLMCWSCCNS